MRPKKASSVLDLWPWFVLGVLCAGCTAFGYGLAVQQYAEDCSQFATSKQACSGEVRRIWGFPW